MWPLRVKVREYIYYPRKQQKKDNNGPEEQPSQRNQEVNELSDQQQNVQMPGQDLPLPLSNRYDPLQALQGEGCSGVKKL